MLEEIVRVEDLHYTYSSDGETAVEALRGVTLSICRGEYLVILGHNGSGKSTLARCLNGLLRPTLGDVWVKGLNTRNDEDLITIRSAVGMVFQNPDNQFVNSVVEEEVAFGPENLGIPRPLLVDRVERALELTGLSQARQRNVRQLSSGERVRLAIADVLAMEPDCLVLDETTAMLDPRARASIQDLLRTLCAQGVSVVAITHNMEEVVRADRILVLEEGRVALEGPPRKVLWQTEELVRLGLGLPVAVAIAEGLREREIPLALEPITHEELVDACLLLSEMIR